MGVQWGVLSDGNRYVLYNSRGGTSFDDQKFLALEIKTVDTDSPPVNFLTPGQFQIWPIIKLFGNIAELFRLSAVLLWALNSLNAIHHRA